MTPPLNRERFAKVLALAESDQDGEALAAVRKASKMARSAGMSLGEAVSSYGGGAGLSPSSMMDGAKDAILAIAYRRIRDLEDIVASLQRQKSPNREADSAAMYNAGYGAGYKAGYGDGQSSELSATNRAYDRGYADGKASASASEKPTARKKRSA